MLNEVFRFCHFWLIFSLCASSTWGILKQDDTLLKTDIITRLTALRQFVPQKHYKWHIRWICNGTRQYGTLEGLQQGQAHWVIIKFSSNKTLIFNKSNPCIALYPNKLCLCKPTTFTTSLADLPGVCIHMLAMPFLNWDIVNYSKTAKLGRRAIKITLSLKNLNAEVFLDKHFNTILQANMWDTQSNFRTTFTLKHLKKFRCGWGIQTAEFTLNNYKTLLYVDDIENLEHIHVE